MEQAILYLVIVMLQHVIEALAETGGLKFENMCSNGNDELCFEVHNSYTLFDCYFHVHVLQIYQSDSYKNRSAATQMPEAGSPDTTVPCMHAHAHAVARARGLGNLDTSSI